jgi:hypothetical protein
MDGSLRLQTPLMLDQEVSFRAKVFGERCITNTNQFWEALGLKRAVLPNYTFFDPITQQEVRVPMTINGIEIDITDQGVIRKFQFVSSFPASLVHESLDLIEITFSEYFNDSDRPRT